MDIMGASESPDDAEGNGKGKGKGKRGTKRAISDVSSTDGSIVETGVPAWKGIVKTWTRNLLKDYESATGLAIKLDGFECAESCQAKVRESQSQLKEQFDKFQAFLKCETQPAEFDDVVKAAQKVANDYASRKSFAENLMRPAPAKKTLKA